MKVPVLTGLSAHAGCLKALEVARSQEWRAVLSLFCRVFGVYCVKMQRMTAGGVRTQRCIGLCFIGRCFQTDISGGCSRRAHFMIGPVSRGCEAVLVE